MANSAASAAQGPFPTRGDTVREYLEGTLILDSVDDRNSKLIWRGWASGALDHDPRPDKVRMYVNKAVRTILEKFPPTS